MADGIGGLFGVGIGGDRESILQQIMKERQARNVSATQNLGKYAGLAQAGMESAQRTQDQVGKMFGVEDPRLQKQTKIQDAAEAVRQRGIDTKDPAATYQAFYEELAKRGMYGEATALIPKIQEAQKSARTEQREERKVAIQEGELSIRKEQEARQGKLTDAQISEIKARIGQGNFDVQFSKNSVTGAIERVYRVNKRTGQIDDITDQVIGKTETPAGSNGEKNGLTDDEVRARLRGGARNTMPADQLPVPGGA